MFFQELQHWICLASINLTSKEFGIIYFFHQISRLSIYIKISALFGWDRRIFYSWKVVILEVNFCQMNLVYLASLDSHWLLYVLVLGCCNTRPIFGKSSHTLIARLSCGDFVDFVCLYSEYSHAIFGEDYPAKVLVFMVHDDEIMRKYSLAYFGRFHSYLGEHPLLFGVFVCVK